MTTTPVPLPVTSLFDRVIEFALAHYARTTMPPSAVDAVRGVVQSGQPPTTSSRGIIEYDRYDINNLVLFIESDAVTLMCGAALIRASEKTQTIYLQVPVKDEHLDSDTVKVIITEPLHTQG